MKSAPTGRQCSSRSVKFYDHLQSQQQQQVVDYIPFTEEQMQKKDEEHDYKEEKREIHGNLKHQNREEKRTSANCDKFREENEDEFLEEDDETAS